jgi:hypothetical protein
MKKILTKTLLGLLLAPALLFVSCEVNAGDTEMRSETFTVDERDWVWNDVYRRYEYIFDFHALDRDMYWNGSVSAGVYMTERGHDSQGWFDYEVFRNLPFVHTYEENGVAYTETIGFDIGAPDGRKPGTISFYIQASDLSRTDWYLTDYSFKVTLLRDEEF